jgi:hypothetical protein
MNQLKSMNFKLRYVAMCLILGISGGCQKAKDVEAADSLDATESVVESAMTQVAGDADDQAGSSYAYQSKPDPLFFTLVLNKAYAANCQRPIAASCSAGVRSQTYSNCNTAESSISMSGAASLTYSQSNCSLAISGDYVERTYDLTLSGPRGGQYDLLSSNQTDYRGQTYGGGGRLQKTSSGFSIAILGRHSELSFRGRILSSVSTRTLQNVELNQLTRNGRILNGGQIEVNHNLAEFTTVISPVNVQWTSTCCHPVSGSLNLSFSGSKSGSATVTFLSCGSAEINENGQTRTTSISYCE